MKECNPDKQKNKSINKSPKLITNTNPSPKECDQVGNYKKLDWRPRRQVTTTQLPKLLIRPLKRYSTIPIQLNASQNDEKSLPQNFLSVTKKESLGASSIMEQHLLFRSISTHKGSKKLTPKGETNEKSYRRWSSKLTEHSNFLSSLSFFSLPF